MPSAHSDRNLVAALSYVLFFITGIVILLVEKEDRFIRFHAMQSTLATGVLVLANIVVGRFLESLGILSFLAHIFNIAVWVVIIFVCVTGFLSAYRGRVNKLPIVGEIAERNVR